ncbi:MAG: hypothetical protein ACD_19C00148G0004, partial [uncultured bacterium]
VGVSGFEGFVGVEFPPDEPLLFFSQSLSTIQFPF